MQKRGVILVDVDVADFKRLLRSEKRIKFREERFCFPVINLFDSRRPDAVYCFANPCISVLLMIFSVDLVNLVIRREQEGSVLMSLFKSVMREDLVFWSFLMLLLRYLCMLFFGLSVGIEV